MTANLNKLVISLVLVSTGPMMSSRADISCGLVETAMYPCLEYLRFGGTVPPSCCNGVRNINDAAQTTPDRQAACRCLKQAAAAIPGLNEAFAAGLPGICHVSIPYKISNSTNCNTVK